MEAKLAEHVGRRVMRPPAFGDILLDDEGPRPVCYRNLLSDILVAPMFPRAKRRHQNEVRHHRLKEVTDSKVAKSLHIPIENMPTSVASSSSLFPGTMASSPNFESNRGITLLYGSQGAWPFPRGSSPVHHPSSIVLMPRTGDYQWRRRGAG